MHYVKKKYWSAYRREYKYESKNHGTATTSQYKEQWNNMRVLLLIGNYHLRLLQSDSVSKTVYWVIRTCMLYSTMLEIQDDMDTS